jgi:hypothetical protein
VSVYPVHGENHPRSTRKKSPGSIAAKENGKGQSGVGGETRAPGQKTYHVNETVKVEGFKTLDAV